MTQSRYFDSSYSGSPASQLGVRLYYQFCGVVLESEMAFEAKVEELCRELGERGKIQGIPT